MRNELGSNGCNRRVNGYYDKTIDAFQLVGLSESGLNEGMAGAG